VLAVIAINATGSHCSSTVKLSSILPNRGYNGVPRRTVEFQMERPMRRLFLALSALGLAALLAQLGPASAQSPATSAGLEAIEGTATIEHTATVVRQVSLPRGAVRPAVGDAVYRGDVVQTGADSKISLAFSDGTAFNIASNARMELNEFVYNPNGKNNSSLFSLAKGTFTFVAGKVAKTGNMKIDTPAATMGIRGTTPHVVVFEDGTVKFSTLVEEKR
jgi:FecR protein